ncbi:MAG: ATP-binding protein [Cyclobacteriaceae bacterium]|nr:ATP-binding protein [Cyclobacteriaceae bacterium]
MSKIEYLQLVVCDEGPGFTVDDKRKLYGKFKRPTGGEYSNGLGLSIIKKYTEAMGGNIICESEIGKRTTFIVEYKMASNE